MCGINPHWLLTTKVGISHICGMDTASIIEAAGGPSKLAKALGLDHSSVIGWRKANRIPAERVKRVAEMTGIAPHVIRPDIFDPPSQAAE